MRLVAGRQTGPIGLGCMGMTWAYDADQRDDAESIAVIQRALDIGVTLLDTADMYGPFTNEELVGRAIEGRRDEVLLATKVGNVVADIDEYVIRQDGRPEHVRESIEGSLKRLRTDIIDLYQLHRVDPEVPLEETWGAMAELVRARQGEGARAVRGQRRADRARERHPPGRVRPVRGVAVDPRGVRRGDPVVRRQRRRVPAVRAARAGLSHRSALSRGRSRRATSARTTRASSATRWTPTRRWWRRSRPLPRGARRRRRRSRSPGC